MQFTSVYYYPSEITAYMILDPTIQVRNIPVYQRNLKLYRGIDNTISVYIQNQDLKNINITGYQLVFNLIDKDEGSIPFATIANVVNANTGVTTVTVGQYDIMSLPKQYYFYSLVATNLTTLQQFVLYTGDNYEVNGTIEVVGDAYPQFQPSQVVTMPGPIMGNTSGNLVGQTGVNIVNYSTNSNTTPLLDNITQLYYPINYAKIANTEIVTTAIPFSITSTYYSVPGANVNAQVVSSEVIFDYPTVTPQTTHTAAFYLNSFTGNIVVQSTLDLNPVSLGAAANSNVSSSWANVAYLSCNAISNTTAISWSGIYSSSRFVVTAIAGNVTQVLYR